MVSGPSSTLLYCVQVPITTRDLPSLACAVLQHPEECYKETSVGAKLPAKITGVAKITV